MVKLRWVLAGLVAAVAGLAAAAAPAASTFQQALADNPC
jgi:hypothetical protein